MTDCGISNRKHLSYNFRPTIGGPIVIYFRDGCAILHCVKRHHCGKADVNLTIILRLGGLILEDW